MSSMNQKLPPINPFKIYAAFYWVCYTFPLDKYHFQHIPVKSGLWIPVEGFEILFQVITTLVIWPPSTH